MPQAIKLDRVLVCDYHFEPIEAVTKQLPVELIRYFTLEKKKSILQCLLNYGIRFPISFHGSALSFMIYIC